MSICVIPLGRAGNYLAIVDQADYEYLTCHKWQQLRSRNRGREKIYARRSEGVTPNKTTVLMHVEILNRSFGPRPSHKHTADHIDGNSLNNTRDNLRWATLREQANNQQHRRPLLPADVQPDIPF